jgi:beta propeller repeat protein
MAVWEDFRNGTWDIYAKNLVSGNTFPVFQGPGDQRNPAVSGSLVVWQDNRNGTWDVYAARLSNNAASPPTPIAVPSGDQLNPDVSREYVVWQSGALALATTTPQSFNRFDIFGAVVTDTVSQPISITGGPDTNVNPAVDVTLNIQGTPASLTVWQSHVPTTTLTLDGSNPRWGVRGMRSFEVTPVPVSIPTRTGGDQTDPAASGENIVWQELYTQTLGIWGSNPRWGVLGMTLPATPFTVTVDLDGPPAPAISGNALTWQELSPISQTWSVVVSDLISGTPAVVSADLLIPPNPDISRDRLVWQALSPGEKHSHGGGDLDIYGNVGTPYATPYATPTSCTIVFSDVPSSHTFYPFIRCLACRTIIGGYTDGTFRPGNDITRGQIAKMVSNAAGFGEPITGQSFEDVPTASPFYLFVERLYRRGHMGGYLCGLRGTEPCVPPDNRPYFRPNENATRGQISKIVSNAVGFIEPVSGQFYTDVTTNNPFYQEIMRLTNRGVMSGYACGGVGEPCDQLNRPYFRWGSPVTRGQASKIVANTFFPNCQTPDI